MRKRIPSWFLFIAVLGLVALTLWLALAIPSVGYEMCRAPWATVLSESAGYADSDQCTRVGQIRFGVAVATGLIALSALTRLMLRLGERRPVS